MATKLQKEMQELPSQLSVQSQTRLKLQMESDSKDSEIEQLQSKLGLLRSESARSEAELKKNVERAVREKEEITRQLRSEEEKKQKRTNNDEEVIRLNGLLRRESMLKQQAVNKLEEIIKRKDKPLVETRSRVSLAVLKRKEIENRNLQLELTQEREQYGQMASKLQKEMQGLQSQLSDESQMRLKLKMELDSKDSKIEQLQRKQLLHNSEFASVSPGGADNDIEGQDPRLEGTLWIPNKYNIKRHGWRRQYVVVSSKKIIFCNSEADKLHSDPVPPIDMSKVFHVRSVTHDDVIRADAKDIPRIFQLLFVGEGEASRPGEEGTPALEQASLPGTTNFEGHKFVLISYRMPVTCEICPRHLWHMFRPPPAIQCMLCRIKLHKDHLDRAEGTIAPCKSHQTSRELLLLAPSVNDQAMWVARLSRKIQKYGYKAHSS